MSYDEESNEYVVYKLCQPICVITSVSISAYQAAWQRGYTFFIHHLLFVVLLNLTFCLLLLKYKFDFVIRSPAYAPKSIRISIGFSRDHMHYTSDLYPIDNVSSEKIIKIY